jgi:hypothetical protein
VAALGKRDLITNTAMFALNVVEREPFPTGENHHPHLSTL